MTGKVHAVCISEKKGTKKREVPSARLIPGWGIEEDAHAGQWHRQVSLISLADIDTMKAVLPGIKPGDFAENIIIRELDMGQVGIGNMLYIGDHVILEITQIVKECHTGCEIQKLTGRCIMPQKGLFAVVHNGGLIKKEDTVVFCK